jgi:glycosyltransferase involved in cell wall biosynthesis
MIAGPIAYTVALCNALAKYCSIDLYCGERYAAENDSSIFSSMQSGVNVILYPEFRRRDPRSLLSDGKLAELLYKGAYDIIHLQFSGTLPLVFYWNKVKHIPLVLTVHDPYQHPGLPKLVSWSQDFTQSRFSRKAGKIIVHGPMMRSLYLRKYPFVDQANVVDLPVGDLSVGCFSKPAPPAEIAPKEKYEILFFGNIQPNKGVDFLVRAEPYIAAVMDNFIIKIIGQGDVTKAEKLIINKSHFEIRNVFVSQAEMAGYFQSADVVVLPYLSATQSGIIPLAYSAGKPVVATRTGGLPDVVQDGTTGLLVEPGDEKALAKAIITLLRDDPLRKRMGENALAYCAEKLSWTGISAATYELYGEIAGR